AARWWNDCELERQSNLGRKVSKGGLKFPAQHSKKSSLRSESLKLDHGSSDCEEGPHDANLGLSPKNAQNLRLFTPEGSFFNQKLVIFVNFEWVRAEKTQKFPFFPLKNASFVNFQAT
uniref:Uncharacterized protein n=1 Tax=Romanomermis culicivorax TaxID=13658 RepID=A0A915KL20_ROMCU